MLSGKINTYISITAIAVIIVLCIQINWIVETVEQREGFFTERVNMVKSRVTEDLSADKASSKNLEEGNWQWEVAKIDSLLRHYMRYYSLNAEYTYEVIRRKPLIFKTGVGDMSAENPNAEACYNKELDRLNSKNSWELKLNFPNTDKYILSQISLPLVVSCVLAFLVLFLFWKTVISLKREKAISEHTTDFLNNMTHEFKTPLTNIALAGKMIGKDTSVKNEDKIRHYSAIILAENEKLRSQVEQVLSMTALERGEIPLRKEEIDLHALIEECVKPISLQIEDKQGKLNLSLNATHFIVTGDKAHLTNAIGNLIDNAIKYSKGKPEINIETISEAGNLIIIVSDKGVGIDKEHQKRIFDKYFRVHTGDVHDVKGFGLGLAYVKKIIELHGGTIELESEQGRGSAFKIKLPYA